MPVVLALAASALIPAALGAQQRTDNWIELRTPHFTVYSDGGERTARRIATQFEQIRYVFAQAMQERVDPGQPILVLAARDRRSLAALLPEYFRERGRARPDGLFVRGPDRNYIALEAGLRGEIPYHTLYHEYTHQVLRLGQAELPLWLEEGYADFFGNTRIVGRDVTLGWAPESTLEYLRQSRLMPLEELFRVDRRSPYYNEESKVGVFYAQSWALVHMLFLDPQYGQGKLLDGYVRAVNDGLDPVEAAEAAFGELGELQRRLARYIGNRTHYHAVLNSPIEEIEKDFAARPLSEAEALALVGGYHLARGLTEEARERLERAVALAPELPAAHEALGLLHLRLDDSGRALEHFRRAVALGSESFLSHYYHGALLVEAAARGGESAPPEAETSLLRSAELNPRFAPAVAMLAELYAREEATVDRALETARRAEALDPSDWHVKLTLAWVLARNRRFEEARLIAGRIADRAREPEARQAAAQTLDFIARHEQYFLEVRRYGAPPAPPPQQPAAPLELTRRPAGGEAQTIAATEEAPAPEAGASLVGASAAEAPAAPPRLYSMIGRVIELDCGSPPAVLLTLSLGGITMKLHAADLGEVAFLDGAGEPRPAPRCAELGGTTARFTYILVNGQPWEGEIVSVAPQP